MWQFKVLVGQINTHNTLLQPFRPVTLNLSILVFILKNENKSSLYVVSY